MSSLRRGAVATVAALVAVSLLAGCGENNDTAKTDFNPVSDTAYDPINGISLDSTIVQVRNLYALADEGPLAPRLRMTLVNTRTGGDALVGATLGRPAVSGQLIGGTAGALPVAAGTSVIVGNAPSAQITFPGLTLKAGTWQPVTLLFRDGRAVAGSVLVQSAVSLWTDGTVPYGRPSSVPTTQQVLPSGEAVNAEEAGQVQQGEADAGHNNSAEQH